jgi:hypothetical protein
LRRGAKSDWEAWTNSVVLHWETVISMSSTAKTSMSLASFAHLRRTPAKSLYEALTDDLQQNGTVYRFRFKADGSNDDSARLACLSVHWARPTPRCGFRR